MINRYSKSKDGDINISEHFKIREFACKDGSNEILIDYDLIPVIERFRQYVETAVPINSSYRTISYNNKIGGASNSYHTKGQALDIPFKQYYKHLSSVDKMCDFFNTLKVKGIIKYSWGVHIDTRNNKYHGISNGYHITFNTVHIPLYKNLTKGMTTNDVGVLQFMLKQLGYDLKVDCNFGLVTETRVKEFQKRKGLVVDGIVGQNTWKTLLK